MLQGSETSWERGVSDLNDIGYEVLEVRNMMWLIYKGDGGLCQTMDTAHGEK